MLRRNFVKMCSVGILTPDSFNFLPKTEISNYFITKVMTIEDCYNLKRGKPFHFRNEKLLYVELDLIEGTWISKLHTEISGTDIKIKYTSWKDKPEYFLGNPTWYICGNFIINNLYQLTSYKDKTIV